MAELDFTKIYVIQSLDTAQGDALTGTALYNDVLRYFQFKHQGKDAELIDVNTPTELFAALDKVNQECTINGVKPIIHFEIHGLDNLSGLCLNNGIVLWDDLYTKLSAINEASRWHLFVTMAVCFGNYAMNLIRPLHPAPFTGILGSFESIDELDLEVRYKEFYQELLNSLDLESSVESLRKANTGIPADYRFISAEQTFKNVFQKYWDIKFSPEAIKSGYKKALKDIGKVFKDRNEEHGFYVQYHAQLKRTKPKKFEDAKTSFFMFDKFPHNRTRYCVGWVPLESKK